MSLQEILGGPLGQRLAWTLFHFLWQGLAIGAGVAAAGWLLSPARTRGRYAVALAGLVLMACCPLVTFGLVNVSAPKPTATALAPDTPAAAPQPTVRQPSAMVPMPVDDFAVSAPSPPAGAVAVEPTTSPAPEPVPVKNDWRSRLARLAAAVQPYAISAWLAGVVVLSGRLLMSLLGVRRLARGRLPVTAELAASAARLADRLGLSSGKGDSPIFAFLRRSGLHRLFAAKIGTVPIYLSQRIREAMLVGLLRPMILVSAAWIAEMPPDVLEAVIAHELAHVRRFDLWANLLQRLVETLLFYHPAVWWLSRRTSFLREMCADELAAEATGDRMAYAGVLEHLGRRRLKLPTPQLAAGIGGRRMALFDRIRNVLGVAPRDERLRWWPAGLLALLAPLGLWLGSTAMHGYARDAVADGGSFEFAGHVLAPDGKPLPGARIYFTYNTWDGDRSRKPFPLPLRATSAANGRFRFSLKKAELDAWRRDYSRGISSDVDYKNDCRLVAVADGYGPIWQSAYVFDQDGRFLETMKRAYPDNAKDFARKKEPALRLVRDDMPLVGRIVDPQGRPIAGVTVRVTSIQPMKNEDLTEWLRIAERPGVRYEDTIGCMDRAPPHGQFPDTYVTDRDLPNVAPAVSDKDGCVRITGIGRERLAFLTIEGPGIESTRAQARTRPGPTLTMLHNARIAPETIPIYGATFQHVAKPSVAVIGIVRDKDSGKPLVGVTIQAHKLAGSTAADYTVAFIKTTTDAQGHYRLTGLPIGKDNALLAVAPRGSPYFLSKKTVDTTAPSDGDGIRLDFDLRRGVLFHGRVTDAKTGEPVPCCTVEYGAFRDNPYWQSAPGLDGAYKFFSYETDADGRYWIPVLPGRGLITFDVFPDKGGERYPLNVGAEKIPELRGKKARPDTVPELFPKYTSVFEVQPAAGTEAVPFDLRLDPCQTLRGTVLDPDGKPLAGCQYAGLSDNGRWETLATAQFTINAYRPDHPRDVYFIDLARKLAGALTIKGEQTAPLSIRLQPWGTITGRLIDDHGKPLGGFRLGGGDLPTHLTVMTADGGIARPNEGKTAEDGRFRIEGLAPGAKYPLYAENLRAREFSRELITHVTARSGETKDLGDLTVKKGPAAKQPGSAAAIKRAGVEEEVELIYRSLRTNRRYTCPTFSINVKDVDGRKLKGVTLITNARGDSPKMTITAEEGELKVDPNEDVLKGLLRKLRIEVAGRSSMASDYWEVEVPFSDASGATKLAAAPNTAMEKTVARKNKFTPQSERVSGQRPQGNCSISGQVIDEMTGKPVPHARMYLFYLPTYAAVFVNTGGDGTFAFENISTGPYSLQTSRTAGYQDVHYDPEGRGGQFPQFSLKPGEQRGGIVLKVKRACRISGKVFDENGKLPHDAGQLTVYAWTKSDDGKKYRVEQAIVNESDCSYVIDGLSDKPVYVMALVRRAPRGVDTWPPIYYPSTFSRSQAKAVTFEKSRSVEGVNITRRRNGGLVIAGTVRDPSGKPVPEALVAVHHRDMFFDQASAYSDAQGRYEIRGLGEGELLMHVDAAHRGFVRTRLPIALDEGKQKTVQDFSLTRGATISGKLVDPSGHAWEIANSYGRADIVTEDRSGHGSWSGLRNDYGPKDAKDHSRGYFFADGNGPYEEEDMLFPTASTFLLRGVLSGHTTLTFAPQKEGQAVAEIRYQDRNIKESGIDTKAGEEIKGVTIVVGSRDEAPAKPAATRTPPVAEKNLVKGDSASPQAEMVLGQRPKGNCSLSGQVISATTGKPVEGARMHLHYLVTHGSIFVHTDRDGNFEIKDIPTGPFWLNSSHTPGYQDAAYSPEGKPARYSPFSLNAGEQRAGIVLKIKPACRISGKIMDENGKPPVSKTWEVLACIKNDGGEYHHVEHARVHHVDGSYVIDGLDNKPVYVVAIDWQAAKEGDAWPPIYFPGTFSRDDAKLVRFDKASAVIGVNITLRKEGGLVLEGTVRDEAGKPVPEAFVVMHRRDDMHFDFNTAYTDAEGHYRIRGLGAGQFLVHVDAAHRGLVRTRTPIDIDKSGEKNRLDFTLRRGVSISGRLVDVQGKAWQIGDSYAYAARIGEDGSIPSQSKLYEGDFSLTGYQNKYRPKNVQEEFPGTFLRGEGDYDCDQAIFPTSSTFLIQGVMPGHTMVGLSPNKEQQKVVKILYRGRDVLTSGIETKPGDEIKDITIVVGRDDAKPPRTAAGTPPATGKTAVKRTEAFEQSERVVGQRPKGNCSLSGQVLDADTGKPVARARVYLFYLPTGAAIFVNTGSDGKFSIKELPKGPFMLQTSHTPGYQDAVYNPFGKQGKLSAFSPFSFVSLKDGEQRAGIVFKLKPACRVTGKIRDENGKAPDGVGRFTVLAWFKGSEGKYQSTQTMVDPRDASYKIDGLGDEPVYVMAIDWRAARQGNARPPIYYPSVFSRSEAKQITFDRAKRVDNVNITLRRSGGIVLRGTVRDKAGKPVPEAFVVAHHRDMLFDFATAYTDQQGRYEIQGLGDGALLVHVDAVHRGFVRMRTPIDLAKGSKDARLDFTLSRGATISGKLVDEKGREWQIGYSHGFACANRAGGGPGSFGTFSLGVFRNKYRPKDSSPSSPGDFELGEGNYDDAQMIFPTKSTFLVQGMAPGHVSIQFMPQKEGQSVLKILHNGRDIKESVLGIAFRSAVSKLVSGHEVEPLGLDLKAGEEIKDVTIVIGSETAAPPVAKPGSAVKAK